jgi:orotate phosphoribosyltransferase
VPGKQDGGGVKVDGKGAFIDFMIGSGVLTFGDFTTKSGRRTPYFINTGNYQTGAQIAALGDWYADTIVHSGERFDALFGPAYKGIPLCVAAASSLYRSYGIDVPYCFNRKEAKDHGEGGGIVGYQPKSGDRLVIIEDVVTAGTAVRESLAVLSQLGDIRVGALFVSVDRMERGTGSLSALDELRETLGIRVYPIVTVRDIIDTLPPGDGRRAKMEGYLAEYGAKHAGS